MIKKISEKILKPVVAFMLILSLTSVDIVLLSTLLISYAIEGFQSTNESNVVFSAFFFDENNNKRETAVRAMNDENIKMYLQIGVLAEGYFNGRVGFKDSNFRITGCTENPYVKGFGESFVELNQINAESNIFIELNVEPIKDDWYNLSKLNKNTVVEINGEYMTTQKEAKEISSEREVQLVFESPYKDNSNFDAVKLNGEIITNRIYEIDGQEKRLVQLKVESGLKDNCFPIKSTVLQASVLDGAEDVQVQNRGTYATNDNQGGIEFNWNKEDRTVDIAIFNDEYDGNVNWNKNDNDTFIISYIFDKDKQVFNDSIELKEIMFLYDDESVLTMTTTVISDGVEKDGILDYNMSSIKDVYKGYLYYDEETNIESKSTVDVRFGKVVDQIEVREGNPSYLIGNDEYAADFIYRNVKLSKYQLLNVLGENGEVLLKNSFGEVIGGYTRQQINETEGDVVQFYNINENDIIITIVNTENEGLIDITYDKVLLKGEYSKEQLEGVERLKSNGELTNDKGLENKNSGYYIELKNPETFAYLETNTTELSTMQENLDVQYNVVLKSDDIKYNLYKNPRIEVEFPYEVTNVQAQLNPIFIQDMEIDMADIYKNEYGNTVVVLQLVGEQTVHSNILSEGIVFNINANVTVDKYSPTKDTEIKFRYTNENDSQMYFDGSLPITLKSRNGLLIYSTLEGFDDSGEIIETVDEDLIEQELDVEASSRYVKSQMKLINNFDGDMSNVKFIGAFSDDTTVNANMLDSLNVYGNDAIITFSEDGENWTQDTNQLASLRLYSIEFPNIAKGSTTFVEMGLNIPENLWYDQVIDLRQKYSFTYGMGDYEGYKNIRLVTANLPIELMELNENPQEDEVNAFTWNILDGGNISSVNIGDSMLGEDVSGNQQQNNSDNNTDENEQGNEELNGGESENNDLSNNSEENDSNINQQQNNQSGAVVNFETETYLANKKLSDGDSVYEGETLRNIIKIANNTNQEIKNLKVNVEQQNAVIYGLVDKNKNNNGENKTSATVYAQWDNGNMEFDTIDSLNPGESIALSYEVIINNVDDNNQITRGNIVVSADNIQESSFGTITNNIRKAEVKVLNKMAYEEEMKVYSKDGQIYTNVAIDNMSNSKLQNVQVEMYLSDNAYINDMNDSWIEIRDRQSNEKLKNIIENLKYDEKTHIASFTIKELEAGQKIYANFLIHVGSISLDKEEDMVTLYTKILTSNGNIYSSNIMPRKIYQSEYDVTISQISNVIDNQNLKNGDEFNIVFNIKNNRDKKISINVMDGIDDAFYIKDVKCIDSNGETYLTDGIDHELNSVSLGKELQPGEEMQIIMNLKVNYLSPRNKDVENYADLSYGVGRTRSNVLNFSVSPTVVTNSTREEMESVIVDSEEQNNTNDNSGEGDDLREFVGYVDNSQNNNNSNQNNSNLNGNSNNNNSYSNNSSSNNTNTRNNSNTTIQNKFNISGCVWLDKNKDGKKDSGEKKLSGVKVRLIDVASGAFVKDQNGKNVEQTTNQNGEYNFSVDSKNYVLIFMYDNTKYTTTNYHTSGISDSINSDAIEKEINVDGNKITVGLTDTISLKNNVSNVDMGLIEREVFDLKLDKYVTSIVVQNDQGTKTKNFNKQQLAKVEIKSKYFSGSSVVIEYNIDVTNEGEVVGYIDDIVDYIPNGFEFKAEMNPDWHLGTDKYLHTSSLQGQAINPGQTKSVKLVLTKTMTANNGGLMTNTAEIYKCSNPSNVKDRDSTAGNRATGEDDMCDASVIISVGTGVVKICVVGILVVALVAGVIILILKRKEV